LIERNTINHRRYDLFKAFKDNPMDKERIKKAIRELLIGMGENPDRDGLKETPERVAKFYNEWLEYDTELDCCEFIDSHKNMVMIRDIPFYSLCEHHLVFFMGNAHVGYIPNGKVIGLSKIVRFVNMYSRRLQIQERLTDQIADKLMSALRPKGVMVVIEAEHLCMSARGVRTPGAKTTTSAIRGVFAEYNKKFNPRQEFLSLLKGD